MSLQYIAIMFLDERNIAAQPANASPWYFDKHLVPAVVFAFCDVC